MTMLFVCVCVCVCVCVRVCVHECVYLCCPHVGSHCEWTYQASHGINTDSPPDTSVRLTDTHAYINRL